VNDDRVAPWYRFAPFSRSFESESGIATVKTATCCALLLKRSRRDSWVDRVLWRRVEERYKKGANHFVFVRERRNCIPFLDFALGYLRWLEKMLRRVLGVSARRLSTRRAYTTLNNVPRRTPPTPLLARSILNTHSNSSIATSSSALPAEDTRPRLSLTFTCTAGDCNHRSSHTFTKLAYEKGTVIIQCPACKNRSVFPVEFLMAFTEKLTKPYKTSNSRPSRMV
jgi:hypothetical protein